MSLFSIQTFITGNMKRDFEIPFEDDDLKTAWLEWEQHRKEKKKKLTPLSVKKQLQFLEGRRKIEIIAIIGRSIMNGWTGLFELPNDGKQANKHQQHTASLVKNFAETYGAIFTSRPDGQGNGTTPDHD